MGEGDFVEQVEGVVEVGVGAKVGQGLFRGEMADLPHPRGVAQPFEQRLDLFGGKVALQEQGGAGAALPVAAEPV